MVEALESKITLRGDLRRPRTARAENNKGVAKNAADMFTAVSDAHPASFVAQAAAIAIRFKESNSPDSALELLTQLRNDETLYHGKTLIQKLVDGANIAHKHSGATEKAGVITEDRVQNVLTDVFGLAHNLSILSIEEIQRIIEYDKNLPKDTSINDRADLDYAFASRLIEESLQRQEADSTDTDTSDEI